MSAVYLIRHGMTEANEKHLYCGSTDLPLSAAGVAALRTLHYDVKNAVYLTSGMQRTEQTLELLFGRVPHRREPRLREMDFGCFEMRGYEELEQRALEAFFACFPPAQDTVIVTHGGVIAAIMARLFPQEGKNRYEWQPRPGRGYAVTPDGYRPIPE